MAIELCKALVEPTYGLYSSNYKPLKTGTGNPFLTAFGD